jgi:hypothetical protein
MAPTCTFLIEVRRTAVPAIEDTGIIVQAAAAAAVEPKNRRRDITDELPVIFGLLSFMVNYL